MNDHILTSGNNLVLRLTFTGRIRPADARVYFTLIRDDQAEREINGKCKLISYDADPDIFLTQSRSSFVVSYFIHHFS